MGLKPIKVSPDTEYTSDLGLPPEQEDPGTPPTLQELGATSQSAPSLPKMNAPMPHSILGDEVPSGEQIPDGEMKGANKAFKKDQQDQAHQERISTLSDFGKRDAAIRGQMAALGDDATYDPDYFKKLGVLTAKQGNNQAEKAKYEKDNPWGTIGNHPGVFGKIGHVLGEIGSVAAPAIAEEIPGSQPYLSNQVAQGHAQEKQGTELATAEQKAQAAGETAAAHTTTAGAAVKKADVSQQAEDTKEKVLPNQLGDLFKENIDRGTDPMADPRVQQVLQGMKAGKSADKPVNMRSVSGMSGGKPAFRDFHPDTGKYFDPVAQVEDPNFIPAPNATTQPQVPVFVPGNTPGSAKLSIIHPGQSFDASNAVNPSQLTATNKGVIAEQGSVNSIKGYQQDFQENRPHLTPSDVESLKVLTSHAQAGIAQHLFQDAGSGVLDALVGQPFTNYTQKLMQGTMTADQYAQLSPAGQKMLFGYTHAIVANFVNMKQKLGSIGRNPDQIQAEMANIPVPYIDINPANEAFTRTLRDAQSTTFNPFGTGGGNQSTSPDNSGERVIDLTKHK